MKEPFEIMPDQEHYSLRWNNHQNHILRAFETLLQTKTLVDVTLVSAESSIRAHKVVLSACSPFFQRVFSETPCKHPVIVLKDFRGWVVQAIVDFMYRGEISVPQERLSVLIQAGESLQVRGLVDHSVAANTPTPAQSPEDFSVLENSLISPSPLSPSFRSSHQPRLVRDRHGKSGHTTAPLLSSNTSKLLMPSQVFVDPSISLSNVESCTSPMPRRKQARPRRRSGECAPQDLSSKPSTPVPQFHHDDDDDDVDDEVERELHDERPDDEDEDIEELKGEDDDLNRILSRSQSVDEKLAAMVSKETLAKHSTKVDRNMQSSESRRSRSLHKSTPRKTSSCLDVATLPKDNGLPQAATPNSSMFLISDGPENLCMKKSSTSCSDSRNNMISSGGNRSERASKLSLTDVASSISTTTTGFSSLRTKCDDSSARVTDIGKASPTTSDSTIAVANLTSRGLLSPKDIKHLNRAALNRSLGSLSPPPSFSSFNSNVHTAMGFMHQHHHHSESKRVKLEDREEERSLLHDEMEPPHFLDHMDLALGTHQHPLAHHLAQQHHHLQQRHASLQLRHPTTDGCNDNNNSENKHNNPTGSQHASIPPNHHLQSSNPNSNEHHHSIGRSGTPSHLLIGSSAVEANSSNITSSNSNNNKTNNSNNNNCNNSKNNINTSNSSNNNNSNHHHTNHPHYHLQHAGDPKGSVSSGGGVDPKDFLHSPTLNFPSFFNHSDGPPRHSHSPLPFAHMQSVSSLTLTPPHMFGLDSPLGLFPPGMDPGKIYSPLMEMSDPRSMHHDGPPFLKKKMNRPKGQHSAPRGGPPRSWTNAELTEALQHVWNKKMTTSQASRIFGIPYNSLLMYVRGKYGKSLKLEQLRKDCISGPPIELLQMGVGNNNNKDKKEAKDSELQHHLSGTGAGQEGNSGSNCGNGGSSRGGNHGPSDQRGPRSASSEPDLLSSHNPLFNPFPAGFYPDFPGGFPGLPLSMLNLLPPERHQSHTLPMSIDEDCKSDRSKQSLDDDFPQPLALNRASSELLADSRREIYQQNGQD